MSEYTPNTREVREYIRAADSVTAHMFSPDAIYAVEAFDRWLAAHDAEVRASVVAEEPEWEYGWRDERPFRWASGTNLPSSFPKTVYPYESRPGLTRVRRRKAGPWVEVSDA